MGRWNQGVPKFIYFYRETDAFITIPIGELDFMLGMLHKRDVSYQLYDNRIEEPVKFAFNGTLKGFQLNTMQKTLEHHAGTIEAPTGSGKTVMGLFAVAYRDQSTLILVHTKDLAHQWIQRACQFLNIKPHEIGLLGDGKKKIGRRLTIGMIQTCYKMTTKLSREFGFCIADECHRAPSRMFLEILSQLHCKYRLGLTATPFRRDGLNKIIPWHCGPIHAVVDKKMLIEKGHILQPIVYMNRTKYHTDIDAINEYSRMLSDLTSNEDRNKQIATDIIDFMHDPSVCALVISDRKHHCQLLQTYVNNRGVNALLLTGDTPAKERSEITASIGKDARLLIATGQLIGEGFDCKNLNTMFICSPLRFAGRVIQYIGRIMRPAQGKERPVVVDYMDERVDVLRRSAKARIRIYGKENVKEV